MNQNYITKRNFRKLATISLITVSAICITLNFYKSSTSTISQRSLQAINDNNIAKPKIHTYYDDLDNPTERALLEAWKKSWSDAMWQPVVLTHLDAKRNPMYGEFVKAFEDKSVTEKLNIYNQHCYFRWLAMGASGGGWMSDFDTFPLHSDHFYYGDYLPYGGQFTSYGGVVPHLLSGSEAEWNRLTELLLKTYKENHHTDRIYSDMRALVTLNAQLHPFIHLRKTTDLMTLFSEQPIIVNETSNDPYGISKICETTEEKVAIHFSHKDCDVSRFCDHKRHLGYDWVNEWLKQCNVERKMIV